MDNVTKPPYDPWAEACEEYAQTIDDDVIWEAFAAGRIE